MFMISPLKNYPLFANIDSRKSESKTKLFSFSPCFRKSGVWKRAKYAKKRESAKAKNKPNERTRKKELGQSVRKINSWVVGGVQLNWNA